MDLCIDVALSGWPVAWFAPTYKFLAEAWREMRETLQPYLTRANATDRRMELITGGVVDMWSLDSPDAGRGYRYARVVIDEAAMVSDLEQAYNAAIRPTLTDFAGDMWMLSTPKGRNYFWRLFQHGQDDEMPLWASWSMPTHTSPLISPDEIEAARQTLPERVFMQEYDAEFLEDSAVFRRILEAATAEPQSSAQYEHSYVIGVDWGKYEDFTVLTVVDITTQEVVCIDRFNMIDYQVQLQRLRALYERFKPRQVIVESNGIGDPLIEQLRAAGLTIVPFVMTSASKTDIIEALMLAFERGRIRIPEDNVLIAELQAFEVERLPSGRLRYQAPSGYHDDCVMSLAMAWDGAKTDTRVHVTKRKRAMIR